MGYVGGTQKRHEKRVSIFGHRAKVQTGELTNTMQDYYPLEGNMGSFLWDKMAKILLKEKKMTKLTRQNSDALRPDLTAAHALIIG